MVRYVSPAPKGQGQDLNQLVSVQSPCFLLPLCAPLRSTDILSNGVMPLLGRKSC